MTDAKFEQRLGSNLWFEPLMHFGLWFFKSHES